MMTIEDVDKHFIRPLAGLFRIDAPDEEAFLRTMVNSLAHFSEHSLKMAAAKLKREWKYRTFPSVADCVETVGAFEPDYSLERREYLNDKFHEVSKDSRISKAFDALMEVHHGKRSFASFVDYCDEVGLTRIANRLRDRQREFDKTGEWPKIVAGAI